MNGFKDIIIVTTMLCVDWETLFLSSLLQLPSPLWTTTIIIMRDIHEPAHHHHHHLQTILWNLYNRYFHPHCSNTKGIFTQTLPQFQFSNSATCQRSKQRSPSSQIIKILLRSKWTSPLLPGLAEAVTWPGLLPTNQTPSCFSVVILVMLRRR